MDRMEWLSGLLGRCLELSDVLEIKQFARGTPLSTCMVLEGDLWRFFVFTASDVAM